MNPPEDVDVQSDLKLEVKGEDDDDIEVTPVPICTQCGAKFKSKIALVKHMRSVHLLDFCIYPHINRFRVLSKETYFSHWQFYKLTETFIRIH